VPLKPPATESEGSLQGKSMIQEATAIHRISSPLNGNAAYLLLKI
jgi:hypothetical protein